MLYILLWCCLAHALVQQDSNGGMPTIRRERKNSKTKSLSPSFQPGMVPNSLNTSTNSLGSFSSEEDDLDSDDSADDSDVLSSSSSSSPEQPASPEDSPILHTRYVHSLLFFLVGMLLMISLKYARAPTIPAPQCPAATALTRVPVAAGNATSNVECEPIW
jgi:hypothetical protein